MDFDIPPPRAQGMAVFMRMFMHRLMPSANMRVRMEEMPTEKALNLFSTYLYCIFTIALIALLLITELIFSKPHISWLFLCGFIPVSAACCAYIARYEKTALPIFILSSCIFASCAYCLLSGMADENFMLYYFWVPPLMIFCLGIRLGSLIFLGFTGLLALLFLPDIHALLPRHLNADFRIRFISAMLSVYILAVLAEAIISRLCNSIYAMNKRLEQYSLTDPLTALGNRRNCLNQFQRLHATQIRSGAPFSIIMIDLDHFKSINDQYGHMLGDDVLCFVADTLMELLRRQDSLFRWGGEEFIMFLPDARIEQAEAAAERLRASIENTIFENGTVKLHITASFGVYTVNTAQDMSEHLKIVDRLLYHAKTSGRNQVASARLVIV